MANRMKASIHLILLMTILVASVTGNPDEQFIKDIIRNYKLTSLTLIFTNELSDICFDFHWLLCLSTSQHDESDLATHLKSLHLYRKQDGIFFAEESIIGRVIKEVSKLAPSLFRSPCPVFIPAKYTDLINPTLDSNNIFYKAAGSSGYTLKDVFAINGVTLSQDIGSWSNTDGLTFTASKYRWNRRTNFKGAAISNALAYYKRNSEPVYDQQGLDFFP